MENIRNIRIEVKRDNYIVVIADSERFGKDEVMFEGNTFDQCFDYLKRELGKETIRLTSYFAYQEYTDRMGRCFPWLMRVVA